MSGFPAPTPPPDGLVLEAESGAEFIRMMRQMLASSGRTAGQVATFGGLPRSTAYHFVSPKNTVLPKERAKVEAFARGCKLSRDQISQVMRIWDELSNTTTVAVGKEIVPAELADIIPIYHEARVLPRSGDGGLVSIYGDINIVHNANGAAGMGGDAPRNDDDEHQGDHTGEGPRSEAHRGFLLDFLGDVLRDRRWVMHAMLLLGMVGMLLFGVLAVFASDKMSAMGVTVAFAGVTVTLLQLMARHGRL